jgi:hypothetical protein
MTELPRWGLRPRGGSFRREGSKTPAWGFPREGWSPPVKVPPQIQIGGISPVLAQGVNVLLDGLTCASRLPPPSISAKHGELDGWPAGRQTGRRKHGESVADAHCCWRVRSLRKRPAKRQRRRAARRNGGGGTALGIALGFSFQVRHRPTDPSAARPAPVELRGFATPPHDGCAFIGTIPT